MKPFAQHHLEERIGKYAKRDPELHEELKRKLTPEQVGAKAERTLRVLGVRSPTVEREPELVGDDDRATPSGIRYAESIVRRSARPVLVIRDNQATTEFLGDDAATDVWAGRVMRAKTALDRIIPSIGRIEVTNNADYTWLGTGWLIDDAIVVTNRHVAREFARQGGNGFVFRLGVNGGPQAARIDFFEEFGRAVSAEFSVDAILWISPPAGSDVAFLRVRLRSGGLSLPRAIPLAESAQPDQVVATIGYPARDSRVPDQALVRQTFGDIYDKKRLAPGQILDIRDDEIEHDCSTLGGNSGSVVVGLDSGQAVGLHFAGLFLEANYAVSCKKLGALLVDLRKGTLPGMAPSEVSRLPRTVPDSTQPAAPAGAFTLQLQIPVEIIVRVGGAIAQVGSGVPAPGSAAPATPGRDVREAALREARAMLAGRGEVIGIRLGYRFKRGWITNEHVVVVELKQKLTPDELKAAGRLPLPTQILGVGIDVRTAPLREQLSSLGIDLDALEFRGRPGAYREPPGLSLDPVKERMTARFHVSPDCGFPNLKAFLARVRRSVVATMYEWEPNHVSDALARAITQGRTLRMVTQKRGTERAVADMEGRLGDRFAHRWASVNAGRLFPTAYHIKVASRDGEEVWLSSGNWKDSNQPDIDPASTNERSIRPLRSHNREWHALLQNKTLADLFQRYIEWDFEEAGRVPFEEGVEVELPEVFLPEEAFLEAEAPVRAEYFAPLDVTDRELEIQPLLTPDRDARGRRLFIAHATRLVESAERSVYVQNQSFNLLEENVDEFEAFFGALRDKQRAGKDVRVIFRDAREFSRDAGTKQQELLERIKDFGLDTDRIKLQRRCHTKGIIVDSSGVLLGSHNLTNEGSLYNRDASLLVRDERVAEYFEKIFLYDWETLATQEADERVGGVELAPASEPTPAGYRRVSLRELLGLA